MQESQFDLCRVMQVHDVGDLLRFDLHGPRTTPDEPLDSADSLAVTERCRAFKNLTPYHLGFALDELS